MIGAQPGLWGPAVGSGCRGKHHWGLPVSVHKLQISLWGNMRILIYWLISTTMHPCIREVLKYLDQYLVQHLNQHYGTVKLGEAERVSCTLGCSNHSMTVTWDGCLTLFNVDVASPWVLYAGLQGMCPVELQRTLGLPSLEKKRSRGWFMRLPEKGNRDGGTEIFCLVFCGRMHGNGSNLLQGGLD